MQVFIKNRGIEFIVTERPAHKEGTATAQNRANDRHIKVNAGGNLRQLQTVVIQNVRQQQVIDMAAVAGHINNFVVFADVFQVFDIVQRNTIVNFIPYPGQQHIQEAHVGVGNIGGNFVGILQRLLLRFGFTDALGRYFFFNRFQHQRLVRNLMHQSAAVG